MSTWAKPLYLLRVASIAVLLVSGGGALLVWMLQATVGPFDFIRPEGATNPAAERIEIELHSTQGDPTLVEAAVERVGPQRLLIRLTNSGSASSSGAVLRVHLRGVGRVRAVRGTQIGDDDPVWRSVGPDEDVEVSLPGIPAASHRAWTIDLEAVEGV